jgi:opacity protein-like surface antigen
MMLTRMLVKGLLALSVWVFISPIALAEITTFAKNWPSDIGSDDQKPATVLIKNSGCASPEDAEEAAYAEPRANEQKRLYVKFGGNYAKTDVRHIRNESQPPLSGLNVAIDGFQTSNLSWEIGLGTKSGFTRYELEYVHQRTLQYNPNPVLIGNTASLNSEVLNNTLLLNIMWDFDNVMYLKPYAGVIGGVVWNKTRTTLTGGGVGNGSAKTNSNYGVAWGVSFGARVPFWTNWYSYLQYRYMGQSKMYWKDGGGTLRMNGQLVFSGFSLGVQYVI